MKQPLRVLYYNTFLPTNSSEGMVSRQFLAAARRLDGWRLTTVPSFQSIAGQKGTPLRRHKKYVPAAWRRAARSFFSPISPYSIGPYLYTRRMKAQLGTALKNESFDLALLHLSQGDLATLTGMQPHINAPLVLRVPAPLAFEADYVLHRHISRRDRQREQFLYEKAAAILVISAGMKQILCESGVPANKIFVYPNGLDFSTFTLDEGQGARVRRELGLVDRPVVGYVGSFWPGNDISTLLRAWQQIEVSAPTAVLLLVGDGQQVAELRQQSEHLNLKNCRWIGRVPYVDVPDYLAAMDVAVGPYVRDALAFVSPLKVMEYAAMGRPVVAADGGQIREIVRDGVTGYTYEPHNAEQLADRVLTLLSAPDMAVKMGRRARTRMVDWYSWDKIVAEVLRLCQETAVAQSVDKRNVTEKLVEAV